MKEDDHLNYYLEKKIKTKIKNQEKEGLIGAIYLYFFFLTKKLLIQNIRVYTRKDDLSANCLSDNTLTGNMFLSHANALFSI